MRILFRIVTCLLFTLSIVAGCKKDPVSPPPIPKLIGVYNAVNTIELSDVKMYTINGEITDKNQIKKRIDSYNRYLHSPLNIFEFNKTSQPITIKMAIEFYDIEKARFLQQYPDTTYTQLFTLKNLAANGFDLISDRKFMVPDIMYPNQTQKLIQTAFDLYSIKECTFFCVSREIYPFTFVKENPELNYLACSASSSKSDGQTSLNALAAIGHFHTEALAQLTSGDTLIVQTGKLRFNKKL